MRTCAVCNAYTKAINAYLESMKNTPANEWKLDELLKGLSIMTEGRGDHITINH